MNRYDIFMEKLAAKIQFSQSDVEEEKRLIERVQKMNDPIALSQLIMKYEGTIKNAIVTSGINRQMDFELAKQIAQNEFVGLIKKYNLNSDNKPNTYITHTLPLALKHTMYDNISSEINMSQEIARYKGLVDSAVTYLRQQNDREPTDQEILHYIKTNMKSTGGKGLTLSAIKRTRDYKVDTWSGNRALNSSNGAENITYEDVYAGNQTTPDDLMQRSDQERMIESEIDSFTLNINERRFLKQIYGIGIYKGKRSSKNKAAINNGITNFLGDKLLRRFREHLKAKGMMK